MATNLFNNLISGMTSVLGLENSTITKISENIGDEKFANVFDSAKSKYISKESSNQTLNKTEAPNDLKTNEQKTVGKEIEYSVEKPMEETDKSEKGSNDVNVDNKNIEIEDVQKVENTQRDSDVKGDTKNKDLENKDFAEEKKNNTQSDIVANEEGVSIVNTTLNNMLLSNVEIENPISQESEGQEVFQESTTINTKTGEVININEDNITVESNQKLVDSEGTGSLSIDENSVDNKKSLLFGQLEEELTAVKEMFPETETFANNDTLVKVDDVIEQSIDDLVIETEDVQFSEISQEIIDEMNVTIRSVEKSDVSNGNKQGGNGFDSRSNAKEEIIRMSLETNSQSPKEFQSVDASANNAAITNSNNGAASITSMINPSLEMSNLNISNTSTHQVDNVNIQQPMSEMESSVLNQINAKLTPLQDGATSKVQIILQPENLGKVSVEIINTKEGVAAKLIAETPQIKEILDKSIESLKNSIATQGVNVNNISVKVEETTSSQNANMGFEQEQFDRESAKHSHQQQSENTNKTNSGNANGIEMESKEQIVDTGFSGKSEESTSVNENGSISVMV